MRSAEFQIGTEGFDPQQHFLQIARDGHFRHRKRQLAVANPQPAAPRE